MVDAYNALEEAKAVVNEKEKVFRQAAQRFFEESGPNVNFFHRGVYIEVSKWDKSAEPPFKMCKPERLDAQDEEGA